ncbi:alpha/beta fold hydrolase [Arsukibacterium sp.]|uniref:alpha/beta fold hydrolase n=1 Tax=Arsukibacterium sp. TaxID=1977258 RepID=UPI002FD8998B
MKHQQTSLYLERHSYQLHLRRLMPMQACLSPVLYIHGAIENGRIFYSPSGKGLACFLADQGFVGYCADLAGRGLSKPHVSSGFDQSQQQAICDDIPALIEHIYQLHQQPVTLIAHSWGGVLVSASLARHPKLVTKIKAKVCFGTKRVISVRNWQRRIKIDWLWQQFAPWLGRRYGFIPAKRWRFGADDEPKRFLNDTLPWIAGAPFTDITDGFDYAAACRQLSWPPLWHFAAAADTLLGHPHDIQQFIQETAQQQARFTLLQHSAQSKHRYDHISMLTHAEAREEHFQHLADWLRHL